MATIPKKTIERLNKTVGKFQKVLSAAKNRDVNEADTVSIIVDMLAEVFGFDKYMEITSEFAIRKRGKGVKSAYGLTDIFYVYSRVNRVSCICSVIR